MRIVGSSLLDPSPVEEDLADLSFISVPQQLWQQCILKVVVIVIM